MRISEIIIGLIVACCIAAFVIANLGGVSDSKLRTTLHWIADLLKEAESRNKTPSKFSELRNFDTSQKAPRNFGWESSNPWEKVLKGYTYGYSLKCPDNVEIDEAIVIWVRGRELMSIIYVTWSGSVELCSWAAMEKKIRSGIAPELAGVRRQSK